MKFIRDEYIRWLRFANAGMLDSGNGWRFDHAVAPRPAGLPLVEIGSFCDLPANVSAHFCRRHGRDARVYCTDKWVFEAAENGGALGERHLSHDQYRTFVMETFKRNVGFFPADRLPCAVEALSGEFFALWRAGAEVSDVFGQMCRLGGSMAFAYDDGSHQLDQCRRDFANVHEFLAPGGFIVFDDSSEKAPFGLCPFMREIAEREDYELAIENPNFLFRKTTEGRAPCQAPTA